MREQFIPYEQAAELEYLGFDEMCFAEYLTFGNKKLIPLEHRDFEFQYKNNYLKAPLWQQAFDYFRENHNLYFEIFNSPMHVHGWKFRTYYIENHRLRNADVSEIFNRYEDAKLTCLVKLISLIKNP